MLVMALFRDSLIKLILGVADFRGYPILDVIFFVKRSTNLIHHIPFPVLLSFINITFL